MTQSRERIESRVRLIKKLLSSWESNIGCELCNEKLTVRCFQRIPRVRRGSGRLCRRSHTSALQHKTQISAVRSADNGQQDEAEKTMVTSQSKQRICEARQERKPRSGMSVRKTRGKPQLMFHSIACQTTAYHRGVERDCLRSPRAWPLNSAQSNPAEEKNGNRTTTNLDSASGNTQFQLDNRRASATHRESHDFLAPSNERTSRQQTRSHVETSTMECKEENQSGKRAMHS